MSTSYILFIGLSTIGGVYLVNRYIWKGDRYFNDVTKKKQQIASNEIDALVNAKLPNMNGAYNVNATSDIEIKPNLYDKRI